MKKTVFIWMLALLGCSNDDENKISLDSCVESDLVENLDNNSIPGIVLMVSENERAYKSHLKYIEVDAQTYLPNVFAQTNEQLVRIFTRDEISLPENTNVFINGEVFSCLTGEHGLPTNDLFNFYLIDNNQIIQ